MIPKVYLAGPIAGTSYQTATGWREYARHELEPHGIEVLSPMRAKDYLKNESSIQADYEHLNPMSTARGLTTRDRNDVRTCDLLFAYLLDAQKVSIGTVIEIAWADAYRIPTILVMNDDNIHNHPMIRESVGYIIPYLPEAIELAIHFLNRG